MRLETRARQVIKMRRRTRRARARPCRTRSPIRLNSVDYKDTDDGSGKLTIDGIGLPGNEIYVFLDDQPLAKALPDDGGKWSIESGTKLDDGKHTLRAEQYDPTTQMLAARAMVSIQRANPGSGEAPAELAAA